MSDYLLTWITKSLAVGHAPMSYAELYSIKDQGIDAIVNLCEEFCDLHELEEKAGFEVFYLPVADEHAPQIIEMEKALEWLDEAIYLGKKILVHCHHGIGRTGTFVTAYLIRRGLGMKKAEKLLKKTRANPTNFSQWWLLRKFGKKEGQLKSTQATPENRASVDLSEFNARYEQLLRKVDRLVKEAPGSSCNKTSLDTCTHSFSLTPIEAIYLNNRVNVGLSAKQRQSVIEKAAGTNSSEAEATPRVTKCPLYEEKRCLLRQYRPVGCRMWNAEIADSEIKLINDELTVLSTEVFTTLFESAVKLCPPSIDRSEAISGKFIQKYFKFLASQNLHHERD